MTPTPAPNNDAQIANVTAYRDPYSGLFTFVACEVWIDDSNGWCDPLLFVVEVPTGGRGQNVDLHYNVGMEKSLAAAGDYHETF